MAKLAILALALAAIVAFAEVSAHRTTITTTAIEDDEAQQCSQEFGSQQLYHCEMYLSPETPSGDVLKMPVDNPMRPPLQQQHLPQCCQQLQSIDDVCKCHAVHDLFWNVEEKLDEKQLMEMLEKLEDLPTKCKLDMGKCGGQFRGL